MGSTLGSGHFGVVDAIIVFLIGLAAAIGGGALGGIAVGGKDLGRGLAALLGSFFGPVAAVPALLVGVVVFLLVR